MRVPVLPPRYSDIATLLPLLSDIVAAGPAVAALDGDRLTGFLAASLLPDFRGKRAVLSPEWANAAVGSGNRRAYEAMYTHLATAWVGDGWPTHLMSVLVTDHEEIESWHWLGFGMIAADAVRELRRVPEESVPVEIRRAGPHDIEPVLRLAEAMVQHTAGSPTFLLRQESRERRHYVEWLADPGKALFLADCGGEDVAFMKIGPASRDACTIIRDETTASVVGAFTVEERRGEGIATVLLNRALGWAGANGYTRCAVDFEPMNNWARRFWLRYFQPVCYTLARHIDGRGT